MREEKHETGKQVQIKLGLEIGLELTVCEEAWMRVRKWETGGDDTWEQQIVELLSAKLRVKIMNNRIPC